MKKWSKLVLATMLSVGTLLVSGCIENIEPEGIADLRGAKAELLRAQTALQAAQAAKVEAEAALVLAKAKVEEAIAKQEEAKAKYEEAVALKAQYEAEAQNITNESARADLEKKIAENELAIEAAIEAAELASAQMMTQLLNAESAAIEAQKAVEQALRDLEIARATLTTAEADAISKYEGAVKTARDNVKTATETLQSKSLALARVIAEIDENGKSTFIKSKENDVRLKVAALEAAVMAEEKALALLELDADVVDWDAQLQEMEDELAALEKEYLTLSKKYIDENAAVLVAVGELKEGIEEYEKITGYKLDFDSEGDTPYDMGTGLFSIIQGTQSQAIPVPDVLIKNDVLGDFSISSEEFYYGKEDVILYLFDSDIASFAYDLNYYKYYDESMLAIEKAEIAKMEEDPVHVAAMERHADAAAAVESGKYLDYFKKHVYTEDNGFVDFDIEEAIADYNEALAAFEKGIADYEAEEVRLTVDEAKHAEITAAETAEKNAAEAVKAKGYQDAESKYAAAEAAYDKAAAAHDAAVYKRDRAIEVAEKTAGANEAEMTTFEAAYIEATASEEDKAKHALYVKALEEIKKARDAYDDPDPEVKTDPASIWAAAQTKWAEDIDLYKYPTGSVYADINAAYTDKLEDIEVKYDAIWADFYSKYPNFSTEYTDYWNALLLTLRTDLSTAATALDAPVAGVLLKDQNKTIDVENGVNLYDYYGNSYVLNLEITGVPWFLVEDGKFVSVTFDDLLDKDYFVVEGELINAADDLWYEIELEITLDNTSTDDYYVYADECPDYPMSHMSYEDFCEFFKAFMGTDYDRITDIDWTPTSMTLIEYYLARMIQENDEKKMMEEYAAIPAHIEAIEAAKDEFIAYVAEVEAELDEFKATVEGIVPAYIADLLPLYDEAMKFEVQAKVLETQYEVIEEIIADYVDGLSGATPPAETLEALEEELKAAYDGAVTNRITAESDLLEAEWALEELKAGNLNAVEIAQLEYDRAAEELAEAIAKLDKANAKLQEILAIIYDGGEIPEDPGTGDEGGEIPEDPGAGDEGDEDEGGEDDIPAA